MIKYVDVEALNMRSQPIVAPSTRKALLALGQHVETLDDAPQDGWWRVRTLVQGLAEEGFVKDVISASPATGFVERPLLRDPMSDMREALVAEAVTQWLRFDCGQGKEHPRPLQRIHRRDVAGHRVEPERA